MFDSSIAPTDFASILAASVHDMKKSLGTIRDLIKQLKQSNTPDNNLMQVEFEASRMNNSLMHLLALYKIEIEKFNLNIDEYSLNEILNDIKAQQSALLDLSHISLELEYDTQEQLCYCDFDLVSNAIGSILNNAQRYSEAQVILSAGKQNGYRYFSIEDDGAGFPEKLITSKEIDFHGGNTGLGLYFVSIIAKLHSTANKQGYIETSNTSRLGGAKFTLFLP